MTLLLLYGMLVYKRTTVTSHFKIRTTVTVRFKFADVNKCAAVAHTLQDLYNSDMTLQDSYHSDITIQNLLMCI